MPPTWVMRINEARKKSINLNSRPMHGKDTNTNDWQTQVALYLDNQLSETEVTSFLEMLQNNPSVSQWVEKEKEFRKFIISNISRPEVTDDLAHKVREIESVL